MDYFLILYLVVVNIFGLIALSMSIKRRGVVLPLFNIILLFSYGLKPVLSCGGNYVVYDGCYGDNASLFLIAFPIIIFYASQFFLEKKNYLDLEGSKKESVSIFPLILIVFIAGYRWMGISSFVEFTEARLSLASGSGILSFFIDSAILFLISINRYYRKFLFAIVVGLFAFFASGQKIFLLIPVLLYYAEGFSRGGLDFGKAISAILVFVFVIVIAQSMRGSDDFKYNETLFLLSIPFDSFDNARYIFDNLMQKEDFFSFLFPINVHHFIESLLQIIPRGIWSEKPEVMGFWRIQRDYLPELYYGPDSMSVSTSLSVDFFFSFGGIMMIPVLFLITYFLNTLSINVMNFKRMASVSIMTFAIEFGRGGFRTVTNLILQVAVFYILFKAVSLLKSHRVEVGDFS